MAVFTFQVSISSSRSFRFSSPLAGLHQNSLFFLKQRKQKILYYMTCSLQPQGSKILCEANAVLTF